MADAAARERAEPFARFLELERAARRAETPKALAYLIVNDTRRLVAYRQAALIGLTGGARVEAVSAVAVLDADAPFLHWLRRVAGRLAAQGPQAEPRPVDPAALPEALRADWADWGAPNVLWVPLAAPDGSIPAALWLAREEPWQAGETTLLQRLGECYAHALLALTGGRPRRRARPVRLGVAAASVLLALGLTVPVRQSALAPAEVAPRDPVLVAAPMEGVIADVLVEPNQPVAAGDALFVFDDTTLRNRREVARRTLAVAEAELRRASQVAFRDRAESARLAVLEAERDMRAAELAYAEELLDRVTVRAPAAGVAVIGDPDDWVGRPVRTGERILLVADPGAVRLRLHVPVADAIALEPGAEVALFLDVDPLQPRRATLVRAGYEAEVTPADSLAYPAEAVLDEGEAAPRIGLQGTAKIYGERVPLLLYLLRRPLAAARQWLGV
jgi:hypothetical protein